MKLFITAVMVAIAAIFVAPAGAQTHIVVDQANVPNGSSAMWRCDRSIASYAVNGLPLTVELRYSGPWTGKTSTGAPSNQGFGWFFTSGCIGDANPATTDVILASNADGVTRGPNEDAIRLANAGTSFGAFVVEGKANCGPRVIGSTHQDGLQSLGGVNMTFRNFEVGEYDEGRPTCQGAGGAFFYSGSANNLDLLNSKAIGCNHALLAGWPSGPSEVRDSSFRSGYAPGDPKCTESGGYAVSNPCDIRADWVNAGGQTSNLVCDRYPFEGDPPPPPPPPDDPPPPYEPECAPTCDEQIADLRAEIARLVDIIDRAAAVLAEK